MKSLRIIFCLVLTLQLSSAYAHLAIAPVGAAESPELVAVQHTAYLMTAPGAANQSTLHIINTSDTAQQFYGTLYSRDGTQLGEIETLLTQTSVPPYGRVTLTSEEVSDLFGDTWSGPAMLEVFGAQNFSLMIRLRSPSGLISNTNCVTEGALHNIESLDSSDLSYVRLINTSDSAITDITGTVYGSDGVVVGTANSTLRDTLGAKQQVFITATDLSALVGGEWNEIVSLYVNDIPGLKLLLVSFIRDNSTFFNFSCFDGSDDLDNPVVVPAQDEEPQTLDITNSILTSRSADCADYENMYFANVTDIQRGQDFMADIDVTVTDASCDLVSDGIPNHNFNDNSANFATPVAEIERAVSIPRNPSIAASTTVLTQSRYDAIMLNGVVLDILSAGCYDPNADGADPDGNTADGCTYLDDWLIDPLGTESGFGTDQNNAHTQPDGGYHYHANPNALFDDNPGANGSPVIGFAADGFPVYGSYFLDSETATVRKALSGYTLKQGSRGTQSDTNPGGNYDGTYVDDYEFADAGDLDECNGMTVDGQYGYYVTDSFPWVIRCFKGTPDDSFDRSQGGGGMMMPMM